MGLINSTKEKSLQRRPEDNLKMILPLPWLNTRKLKITEKLFNQVDPLLFSLKRAGVLSQFRVQSRLSHILEFEISLLP